MRIRANAPSPAVEWHGPESSRRGAPPGSAKPSFAATLAASPTPSTAAHPPAGSAPPRAAPGRALFERAIGAERNMDVLLQAAATGRTFRPGELLALQAAVFRYSQTVEVVSRVADRLVGAIKQTMGTQV
jgi:hypothetical protein